MGVRIAVAAVSFSGFQALVLEQLRKHLRPGQSLVECATLTQGDAGARQRLLALLAAEPRPVALIGICLRPDPPTLAAFRAAGVPVALIDEAAEGASTIASDNFAGGYIAGQQLVRAGRRSIAVVSGRMNVTGGYNALQRVKGFARALAQHRLPFAQEEVVEVADYTHQDGVNAMTGLLDGPRAVDAVFCAAGDACATGLLEVARARGVRIPQQLAVVGYDDHPVASAADPPLTTIRQPLERMAAEALRLVTEATAEILARPKAVFLEPTLVPRASA